MEKNANYALVGLSTVILTVAAIIFVIWLGRVSVARQNDLYDIVFAGPVRGLNEGGEVHFNGIKVGEVTHLALDRRDPNRVIARARITSDAPVRVDSRATLEPQGVTGVNYVQITAGTPSKRMLKETVPEGQVPVILSQRSTISDFLEGGGTVLSRTIEALDRVNRVLSDQNIQTFGAAMNDIQAITAEARERKAVIADAQKALQSIDQAAQEISAVSRSGRELVDTDGKRTLKELGDAAEEIKAAAKDVRTMVGSLEGPTNDFATSGLPQLTSAIVTLQSAAESLERLSNEIEQSPQGLIGKPPAKEVEVKP